MDASSNSLRFPAPQDGGAGAAYVDSVRAWRDRFRAALGEPALTGSLAEPTRQAVHRALDMLTEATTGDRALEWRVGFIDYLCHAWDDEPEISVPECRVIWQHLQPVDVEARCPSCLARASTDADAEHACPVNTSRWPSWAGTASSVQRREPVVWAPQFAGVLAGHLQPSLWAGAPGVAVGISVAVLSVAVLLPAGAARSLLGGVGALGLFVGVLVVLYRQSRRPRPPAVVPAAPSSAPRRFSLREQLRASSSLPEVLRFPAPPDDAGGSSRVVYEAAVLAWRDRVVAALRDRIGLPRGLEGAGDDLLRALTGEARPAVAAEEGAPDEIPPRFPELVGAPGQHLEQLLRWRVDFMDRFTLEEERRVPGQRRSDSVIIVMGYTRSGRILWANRIASARVLRRFLEPAEVASRCARCLAAGEHVCPLGE